MKRRITRIVSTVTLTALLSANTVWANPSTTVGSNQSQSVSVTSSVYQSSDVASRDVFVGLKSGKDADLFIEKKGLKNKKARKIKTDTLAVRLSENEIDELRNDQEVRYVENIGRVQVASTGNVKKSSEVNSSQTVPWGIHAIGADISSSASKDGKGVKIAVLDTGIANHADLKVSGGISLVGDEVSPNYVDDNGHGTHVAGTIAAQNNGIGVVGTADKADLYSVKVLDSEGAGSYEDVIEGIEWAIQKKVDIISMSFGGSEYSQALQEAIKEASDSGILMVAAAGNMGGQGEEKELYPARFPEVVSVGATTKFNTRAPFSSTGNEIDIVAPGLDILSTTMDGNYGTLSGTSMAAPHFTGAAAALWSTHKNWSSSQVKNTLLQTATPLGDQNQYGSGLLNLAKALGVVSGPIDPVEGTPQVDTPSEVPYNIRIDQDFLMLSNKILSYKEKAIEIGNVEIAKKIEDTYNNLLIWNQKYHQVPDQLKLSSKDDLGQASSAEALDAFYQSQATKFDELRSLMNLSIQEFSSLLPVNGEADLPNAHALIDTYEYNGTMADATAASLGSTYGSYISTSSDIDYYKVYTGSGSGTLNFQLQVPSGKDYDVQILDANGNQIASGAAGSGITENVNASLSSYSYYYVKVFGYGGAYHDSAAYYLTIGSLAAPAPSYETIYLNSSIDVSLPNPQYKVYRFTPSTSGTYKIFTGPYGGYGSNNDTILEMYYDAGLTSTVPGGTNDDSNGTNFSTVELSLSGGTSYYIKLKPFGSWSLNARITINKVTTIQTLYTNSSVDVSVGSGEYQLYRFTPSSSGYYKFVTGPYGGSGSSSDTYLHLYTDQNMTNQLAYDDDSAGNTFSLMRYQMNVGQTYYVKFRGYNDGSASARITASLVGYRNVDYYVAKGSETPTKIDGNFARIYDDGVKLISGTVLPTGGLREGNQFFVDETSTWYETNYLRSNNYNITEDNSKITLYINSGTVLAAIDKPTGGGNVASTGNVQISAEVSQYSSCTANCDYVVYMMTGMMSPTGFFDSSAQQVAAQYPRVKIVYGYPYGVIDNLNPVEQGLLFAAQLKEIQVDRIPVDDNIIWKQPNDRVRSTMDAIKANYDGTGKVIVVGHSGGGVMAYKASYFLNKENFWVSKAFSVGSPKFPLTTDDFNSRYVYIIGQNWDPVTSIGVWQGSSGYQGLPGESLTVNLNPANKRMDFHIRYFWHNPKWTDGNGVDHYNDVDLINVIKSKSP